MIPLTFGQRVKKYRESLGLSQDELAQSIGYKSRSSINKIELDKNEVTQTVIVKLAEALKTTPCCLMGWSDNNDNGDQSSPPKPLSKNAVELVEIFNSVNEEGQEQILTMARLVGDNDRYKKRNKHVVAKDA